MSKAQISHSTRGYSPGILDRRISRRDFLKAGGAGLGAMALSTILPNFVTDQKAEAATGSSGIALGAFAPSLPWSFEDIDNFSTLTGHNPAIIHWFQDWTMDFDPDYMNQAALRKAMPLVSWEPWDWNGDRTNQPEYSLRAILRGDHDAYIRRWARAAAAWGRPFYLRFAAEMNADWDTWSPQVNGNTSSEYIAVWRKVHRMFRRAGATNARWVWCPVVYYKGSTPFKAVYPGDAYVDWVGLDGYNWGNLQSWSHWQSAGDIFGQSYRMLTRMTRKPVMIPEVASTEHGGNKARWILDAFLREIPYKFPRVKAIVWFDADKETDWRVNSSSPSLSAYRKIAANRRFRAHLT